MVIDIVCLSEVGHVLNRGAVECVVDVSCNTGLIRHGQQVSVAVVGEGDNLISRSFRQDIAAGIVSIGYLNSVAVCLGCW